MVLLIENHLDKGLMYSDKLVFCLHGIMFVFYTRLPHMHSFILLLYQYTLILDFFC